VGFALLVGAVLGTGGWLLGGRPATFGAATLALSGFCVGTLAVVAHLLGDALTPAGIAPLWPLSSRNVTFSVTRADNTVANYALFGLGVAATAAALLLVAGHLPA
jgi:inner membrane protein